VVGHPGAPGKTEGVVTHLRQTGGPEPKVSGLTVLVCHHVEPWMQDHVARAAAVVERAGSRLGLGSVLARRAGIPLVCGAREAGLLVEGSRAGVSGDSGIVTVTSQT
jgi:phosphohistidine swiveling domain-containing protein